MNKKKIIGIAGYSGSGKSEFARLLLPTDGMLIDADSEAKKIMTESQTIKKDLVKTFGSDSVIEGKIQFSRIGRIVFNDLSSLKHLNRIVHPALVQQLKTKIMTCTANQVLLDAALIPLWNIEDWFDWLFWVDAEKQIRAQRIHQRMPQISKKEIRLRFGSQHALFAPPENKNWIRITNNTTLTDLKNKAEKYKEKLTGM